MWIVLAVAAPVAAAVAWFWVSALPIRRMTRHLAYDSDGLTISATRRVSWTSLSRVEVHTTAGGPWFEDFCIVLHVDGRSAVRIPEPLVPRILAGLHALPGFDNETLFRAIATCTKARFACWIRRADTREVV